MESFMTKHARATLDFAREGGDLASSKKLLDASRKLVLWIFHTLNRSGTSVKQSDIVDIVNAINQVIEKHTLKGGLYMSKFLRPFESLALYLWKHAPSYFISQMDITMNMTVYAVSLHLLIACSPSDRKVREMALFKSLKSVSLSHPVL